MGAFEPPLALRLLLKPTTRNRAKRASGDRRAPKDPSLTGRDRISD